MKTLSYLISLFALVAAAQAATAFESIKVDPTLQPQMPFSMLQRGILEGRLVVAIDVSAEGKLTDHLVVGYTHEALVKPVVAAMQVWQYQPARKDGVAIPAQLELTITLTATGVVISQTGIEAIDSFVERLRGSDLKYRASSAKELDRIPVRSNTVSPRYAEEAQKQGVRGKVQVHFYIDENGEARMPAIDNSDHPYLAEMAVEAVRTWKFEPPTAKGRPVLVEASQEFSFGDVK